MLVARKMNRRAECVEHLQEVENKSRNRDDADTGFETKENATKGHKLRKKVQNSGRRMPLTTDQQYSADTKQDETPRAPQEIKRENRGS